MKGLVWVLMVVCCVAAVGQTPAVDPAEALGRLAFLQGDWAGRQDFNTGDGPKMIGDATDRISTGIAGKYVCEMLSTTLPGRKPTDTRHFISFDKATGKYTAWWFNDTSYHPMALTGDLTGNKLVLMSDGSAGPVLRATYDTPSANTLTFLLEMKMGDGWNKLFLTTYKKKAGDAKP